MKQKKYMNIERLKINYENCFDIGEEITISEKIDGSNASFSYDPETDSILAFSRRQPLNEINTLNGFWEWTQRLDKQAIIIATQGGRLVIFGEWLTKHSVSYPENRMKNFYMFDVWDTETEEYLPFEDVSAIYAGLSKAIEKNQEVIYMAPIFYQGPFNNWKEVYSFVGKTELEAAPCGEGIVVKSQERLKDNNSRRPIYLKIVSEQFAEVKKTKKPLDPEELKKKEALRNYASTVVTYRRAEKIIQKMIEDNIIPEDWDEKDMGVIAKNIGKLMYADCLKEEEDTVKAIENFGKICNGLTMEYVRKMLKERTEVKV